MDRKFSIITVTWNNADGLRRTLESIRALSYKNKEVIVIDGASTDHTADIIKLFEAVVTTFISEKDNGIYNAMNKGITHATGDYVVFMNAGDEFAAADTLDIVSRLDGDIILGSASYGGDKRIIASGNMSYYDVLSIGINHQSTYYKTELIRKYGFDESVRLTADLKSVIEPMVKENARVVAVSDILSVCEGGGVSKQQWRDIIDERKRIIEDVFPANYREDYLRLAYLNHSMIDDFIVISHFRMIFPLIRFITKVVVFLNKHFKHIPLPHPQNRTTP